MSFCFEGLQEASGPLLCRDIIVIIRGALCFCRLIKRRASVCRSGSKDPLHLLGKSYFPPLPKPGGGRGWRASTKLFCAPSLSLLPSSSKAPPLPGSNPVVLQPALFGGTCPPSPLFPAWTPARLCLPPIPHAAPGCSLTSWPGVLPKVPGIRRAVGVPVAMGHSHVLEAVVLGGRRGGVGQPIGLMAEPIAGAVPLGRAQGARPFAEVLRMHGVAVQAILFGPGPQRHTPQSRRYGRFTRLAKQRASNAQVSLFQLHRTTRFTQPA